MSTIAVHIVTYNNEDTIEACLQALLEQDVEVQICIIDNCSNDSTVRRIEKVKLPVTTNSVNLGYAAAHNQAIRLTQSDYILTLNPDVVLQSGFLSSMQAVFDAHPEIGLATGCLLRVESLNESPQIIDSTGLYMRRNRRQGLWLENAPISERPTEQREVFGPDGAAAFYRRTMFEDIAIEGEFFDEDFFIHKEDVDVCWRALLRGWKAVYVPQAQAHHIRTFRPGQRKVVDPFLRMCAVRNRYLLMLKNEIPAHFFRDLFHILAYDFMIFVYILVFEFRSLKGIQSAWRLRKKMLHKRRIIQQNRKVTADDVRRFFV